MHLVLNKDMRIVASANYAIDEEDCAKRQETVIYLEDYWYKPEMIGSLFAKTEPYYIVAPSQFHCIINGEYVLTDDGIKQCWNFVRTLRNSLIGATDWTQLADVTLDDAVKAHYVELRSELRNITTLDDPLSALTILNTYALEIKR
jgi:hypothetical protein